MGVYLNPGNVLFRRCLDAEIYVDKTELIHHTNALLNTVNNLICVSRPRRFGKSMALSMLAAYYSKGCDSKKLFAGLKVCNPETPQNTAEEIKQAKQAVRYAQNLNHYDVLLIDMQGVIGMALNDMRTQREITEFYQKKPHMSTTEAAITRHPLLVAIQRLLICDIRENREYAGYIAENESSLGNALSVIYKNTGKQFILLIDEWDCIFRNYKDDKYLQDKYSDWLRDMFKNTALLPVYALAYMTGILPIKRYNTQSTLNNFNEYTMLSMAPLEEFTGFTEEETMALYDEYSMDKEKAREWYDGYRLDEYAHIYNPNSVVKSLTRRQYKNFWTATGIYESVKTPIEMNFDGLKEKVITMLGGGRCRIDTAMFNNTMTQFGNADDVLTFLIHLGYLGYDGRTDEAYIPNREIRDEFVRAIKGNKYMRTHEAIEHSRELLEATLACDEQTVAACIEKVHEEHSAILTYNNENALSCIIHIAYYQAQDEYKLIREMPTGKGFCDIAFLPRPSVTKPAIVIELKWDKNAETAINQIKNNHYSEWFKDFIGDVLLVGISYEKSNAAEKKKHTCKIERVRKSN